MIAYFSNGISGGPVAVAERLFRCLERITETFEQSTETISSTLIESCFFILEAIKSILKLRFIGNVTIKTDSLFFMQDIYIL